MRELCTKWAKRLLLAGSIVATFLISSTSPFAQTGNYEFNDSHFHLTNNVQEGPSIGVFLKMMDGKAGRVA